MSAPKRYTEEVKAEAVRRYMAGESSPKIAADIGCMPCTVMDWVNKSFETPEMPETPKRSEDTMIEEKAEKAENTTKEKPAAVGAATGIHENICHREKEHPNYDYYSTMTSYCQEVTM